MHEPTGHRTPPNQRTGVSRRRFVIGAALGATASWLLPFQSSALLPAKAAASGDLLASLSRDHFAALVGQTFRIKNTAGHRTQVVLRAVLAYEPHLSGEMARRYRQPAVDCFTVLFRGPARSLAQGTYQVEHPRFGTVSIFLVPTPAARNTTEYVAVFNRLLA